MSGEHTALKILQAAEKEFLEKGYRDASLRHIARKAGVTTGSLYWHFKNKDALFEALIKEHYDRVLQIYDEAVLRFFEIPKEKQKDYLGNISEACMQEILLYVYAHLEIFQILLKGAEGTKYRDLVQAMSEVEIRSTHQFEKHLMDLGTPPKKVTPQLEQIVVNGMFTGMFDLVKNGLPYEKAKQCAEELLAFYTAGWRYILNVPDNKSEEDQAEA